MLKFAWLPMVGLLLTALALAAFEWPVLSLAGESNHGKPEKIMSPLQQTTLARAVPAKAETATFALG